MTHSNCSLSNCFKNSCVYHSHRCIRAYSEKKNKKLTNRSLDTFAMFAQLFEMSSNIFG